MSRGFRPHRAGRPHWRCTACGAHWPCGPARLALLTGYAHDRVTLAVHLATVMLDALHDGYTLGHRPDHRALHERFLGWLARRGAAPCTAAVQVHAADVVAEPPSDDTPTGGDTTARGHTSPS